MRSTIAIAALGAGVVAGGCDSPVKADGSDAASANLRACGDEQRCTAAQMCVATQGAVCMPLPPPGGQCEAGCVPTAHCCNCTTYACVEPAPELCPDGPSCACLAAAGDQLLRGCEPDRRQCQHSADGVEVLCIAVGLDEDPFADAGL